jgi:DNA polymerase III epsilon subunit-like protein
MKLSDLQYVSIDTETCWDIETDSDNELVEYGAIETSADTSVLELSRITCPHPKPSDPIWRFRNATWGLCKPKRYMTPEISSAHDINMREVERFPGVEAIFEKVAESINDKVVVIYNAWFDWEVLKRHSDELGIPIRPRLVLDALPLARKLFPERKKHKLSVMKHAFDIPIFGSHRALHDAYTLALVFNEFVRFFIKNGGNDDVKEFTDIIIKDNEESSGPFDIIPFGKHKGKKMSEVDSGYLFWWVDKRVPEGEPFHRADYSFYNELYIRGEKKDKLILEDLKRKCVRQIPWPHTL